MSTWIDVIVYSILAGAVWFTAPGAVRRFAALAVADRNPPWAAAHPEILEPFTRRAFVAACRGWGLISIAAVIALQSGAWPAWVSPLLPAERWEALRDINSFLLLTGLVVTASCAAVFHRRFLETVPLSDERRATLVPRSMDDFVPGWVLHTINALTAVHVSAWVGVSLLIPGLPRGFWMQAAFMAAASLCCALMTQISVVRRPSALSPHTDRALRRFGVRLGLAVQCYLVLSGGLRLYDQAFGPVGFNVERATQLVLAAALSVLLIARVRAGSLQWPPSASALQSKLVMFVAVTLLANASPAAQPAPQPLPSDAQIRQTLVDRLDTHHQGLGMIVGIVDASGQRVIAHGVREKGGAPIDGDSVFELASVTKVFTALLLADAVQRGEVGLSDPVSKYLPAHVRVPERSGRTITLIDLATHTSGLPREPANLAPKDPANPFADYSVHQLYDFVSAYQLTRDPGTSFEYSNLGAGLLGHALAWRAGLDYESLVRSRILDPLDMRQTGVTFSPSMRSHLAIGHNLMMEPVANWDSPALAGAGALRSTANDMLKFLAAAIGRSASTLEPAFATMSSTRRPMLPSSAEVGLGWGIVKNANVEVYWVNGRSGGYRTWLGYEPSARRGAVILTNTDTAVPPDDIGMHLLNPAFQLRRTFPPPPKQRTESSVDPRVFERLIGQYDFAPGVSLTVRQEGTRRFIQVTGQPACELFAESATHYFVKVVDAQLVFEVDGSGRSVAVVLHQGGVTQRAIRTD